MAFSIVIHQMIIFFIILLVGYIAAKLKIIKEDYLSELAKIISKILLPVLLFYMTYTGTT